VKYITTHGSHMAGLSRSSRSRIVETIAAIRACPAMRVRHWFVAVAAAVALGLVPGTSSAQVRVDPVEVPFYAREIVGPEWTAFVFYRPPECVPEAFNLELFFDVPGAFSCNPMTTASFAVFEHGPGLDPGPHQARARGLGAVPIWFISTEDYLDAAADGVLRMAELRALRPLMGSAQFYSETLHATGAANVPLLVVNATGALEDGRSFRLHAKLNFSTGSRLVQISFAT
jgi:hypothetical protein